MGKPSLDGEDGASDGLRPLLQMGYASCLLVREIRDINMKIAALSSG